MSLRSRGGIRARYRVLVQVYGEEGRSDIGETSFFREAFQKEKNVLTRGETSLLGDAQSDTKRKKVHMREKSPTQARNGTKRMEIRPDPGGSQMRLQLPGSHRSSC